MSNKITSVSVVINTLNEEVNISECIESVSWADEVIVVDMHSDDKTALIAEKLGAKVFLHKRMGYVEPARNFAISKAKHPWVLVLDADERIGEKLATHIKQSVSEGVTDVFYIPEKNIVFGAWVKGNLLWPDYHPRLFRKGHLNWSDKVHDIPAPKGVADYFPAEEGYAIEHYSRSYTTVAGFLRSYVSYSEKEIPTLEGIGYEFRRRHIFLIPYREFRNRYFKAKSYRDGFRGLLISVLFSFYKVMVIAQFWEKHNNRLPEKKSRSGVGYLLRVILDR